MLLGTLSKFLLTRLLRGVTIMADICSKSGKFLLTRLLRGVTDERQPFPAITGFLLTRLLRGVTDIIFNRRVC